jgi:hypothetical protein
VTTRLRLRRDPNLGAEDLASTGQRTSSNVPTILREKLRHLCRTVLGSLCEHPTCTRHGPGAAAGAGSRLARARQGHTPDKSGRLTAIEATTGERNPCDPAQKYIPWNAPYQCYADSWADRMDQGQKFSMSETLLWTAPNPTLFPCCFVHQKRGDAAATLQCPSVRD